LTFNAIGGIITSFTAASSGIGPIGFFGFQDTNNSRKGKTFKTRNVETQVFFQKNK